MNIPNLPTDNFYKFLSLAGLVTAIASFIIFNSESDKLDTDINDLRTSIVELEADKVYLESDSIVIARRVNSLSKIDSSLLSLNSDSITAAYFKANAENLKKDKNLREYFEFLFDNEEQINPEIFKIKKIMDEIKTQKKIMKELFLKESLIVRKNQILHRHLNKLKWTGIFFVVFFTAGIFIAIRGFSSWYKLVQKPSDEKLKFEIEAQRKK